MIKNIDKNGIQIRFGDLIVFCGDTGVIINQYIIGNNWKVLVNFPRHGLTVVRSNEVEVLIEDPIEFKSIIPI